MGPEEIISDGVAFATTKEDPMLGSIFYVFRDESGPIKKPYGPDLEAR